MTSCSEVLQERTVDPEVFQDMDNFDLLNDPKTFALSIRLQFPKFSKGFSSSDFDPFVKSHVGEDNLISLGRLAFPNEWQMQLKSKDVRESLIRMGRTKINTRTCWISPLSQSEVRGFIHWIPNAIPNKKLEEFLEPHGEVLFTENQKQSKWSTKVESDSRYFSLYLRSGKTKDDVPHFIHVGKFLGLITIRGRDPACFHCKQVGHRKTECKKFREKLSDYSLRPPTGVKRLKPRGRRHVPVSNKDICAGGSMPECIDCVNELKAAAKKESSKKVEPKNLPVFELALASSSTASTSQTKPANDSNQVKDLSTALKKMDVKGKIPALQVPDGTGTNSAISSPNDPLKSLEDLQKKINDVLSNFKTGLERDFDSARNLIETKTEVAEAATPATTEGKKKRKKKKKKAAATK